MSEPEDALDEAEYIDEIPVVYSQQAMVGVSFYDFSLVFFRESYRGTEPVANVTLPPAAAKHLAQVMTEYVGRYEELFGEIQMPPDPEEVDGASETQEAEE